MAKRKKIDIENFKVVIYRTVLKCKSRVWRRRAAFLMGEGKVRFFMRRRVEQREGVRMIFLDNVPLHAWRICKQPCVWTKIH